MFCICEIKMENKKRYFFFVKLGIFGLELGKKYFLALGMGPFQNRVIENSEECGEIIDFSGDGMFYCDTLSVRVRARNYDY